MKKILFILFMLSAINAYADDIGFGHVMAIKQYDFNASKVIRVYLSSNSTHQNSACLENCRLVGIITHSSHDEAIVNRMLALVTSAYM